MDLIELKMQLTNAVNNNTLLTPKHDPNNLNTIYSTYRSDYLTRHHLVFAILLIQGIIQYINFKIQNKSIRHTT
jgi:hypothetical protein